MVMPGSAARWPAVPGECPVGFDQGAGERVPVPAGFRVGAVDQPRRQDVAYHRRLYPP